MFGTCPGFTERLYFRSSRRIEIEYSRLTGVSLGYGHITFGTREQAEAAVLVFTGRLLPHGEWGIDMPKGEYARATPTPLGRSRD